LSPAQAAVDNLPENVGDVLRHSAKSLADEIHCTIDNLRPSLQSSNEAARAVDDLDAIPGMILSTFEESVRKAQGLLRQHIEGIIQDLKRCNLASDEIAEQLWTIPEEVQSIAIEAVNEAALESKDQTTRQLDGVEEEQNIFEAKSAISDELAKVQWQVDAATATAVGTVKQAVQVVNGKPVMMNNDGNMQCLVTNFMVSSALLHAKAMGSPDSAQRTSHLEAPASQSSCLDTEDLVVDAQPHNAKVDSTGKDIEMVASAINTVALEIKQNMEIETMNNAAPNMKASADVEMGACCSASSVRWTGGGVSDYANAKGHLLREALCQFPLEVELTNCD